MTQEEIKAMQDELENLRAENKRLGDEAAAAIDAANGAAEGRKPLHITPGQVTLPFKPANGGKIVKKTLKVADGFPYIRIEHNKIVQSSVLLKLANGTDLGEKELEANAALKDWKKNDAVEFLTRWAAKGVSWLVPVEAA